LAYDVIPPELEQVMDKVSRFLAENSPQTPCLVIDLDTVAARFRALKAAFPRTEIFYAVKANPAQEVVARLAAEGASFDVASPAEIDICLQLGARPAALSYGNTIKKESDIAYAYAKGVRIFAFDSHEELEKLARSAPGARLLCRIRTDNSGAQVPLGRKFGCDYDMAFELLVKARDLGLVPYGICFHVGSQQTDAGKWDSAIQTAAELFEDLAARGINLSLVNLGGGFPARYREALQGVDAYARAIDKSLTRHFGNRVPNSCLEPGRFLVGDAGVIESEVILVARKSHSEDVRWVYLDIGRFGGLAETEDGMIKYIIRTPHEDDETGPVVLAGPTCDTADILYEAGVYEMPLGLKAGDKVQFLSAGAYTQTYASIGFNGFPPLKAYYI
jgi:ornithine decarboxylase